MRAFVLAFGLLAFSAAAALAGSTISREEAIDKAHAAGFTLISKTEASPNTWDIWASKDGLPYELTIDAHSGTLLRQTAVEWDD